MTNPKNKTLKYLFLCFLGLGFFTPTKAQSLSEEEQAYQNQFEKILASNQSDTSKYQYILDNLNNLNARISPLPISYAKKGIALAKQKNAPKWNGLLSVELGWIYQGLNEIKAAESAYQDAIIIFSDANLLIEKAKAHGKLSLLYGQTNRPDQALQQARESASISQSIGDESGLAYAYYAMSYNFINAGKDQQALEYINKSIQLYRKHGETYRMAVVMQNKVTCYLHLGEPQKALTAANELIETIQNHRGVKNEATDKYYLGQALHSRAKVYMQLQEYDKALIDNDSLQVLLSNNGTLLVNAVYLFQKAKILYHTQQYQASKKLCLSLLKHPTVEAERFLGYTYEYLSKNCVALNQYKSAYTYHLAFEKYEEKEVFNASKLKMEELEAKYKTEKNAATIQTQKERLTQQRLTQWFAIGFAGILGLLLLQTFRNVKVRKQNNEALRLSNSQFAESNALLAEKNKENELLLKEIHHRVKNNLEIVSSLLELQAARIADVTTQNMLKDSQNRVQSMGIIHQKLYTKGNLNSVEMRGYFKNLSKSILETYNAWDRLHIDIQMEPIELDLEAAIPIGLIVNELITNAWKYAFPKATFTDKKGIVKVTLSKIDAENIQLSVTDNGVGKDPTLPIQGTGFGAQLIHLLTQQLNGTMTERMEQGTLFIFNFRLRAIIK